MGHARPLTDACRCGRQEKHKRPEKRSHKKVNWKGGRRAATVGRCRCGRRSRSCGGRRTGRGAVPDRGPGTQSAKREGAGGDLAEMCVGDPKGQGDHGGVVWPRGAGDGEPEKRDVGRGTGGVRQAPAGGSLPACDSGRPLREGAGRTGGSAAGQPCPRTEPNRASGAGIQRHRGVFSPRPGGAGRTRPSRKKGPAREERRAIVHRRQTEFRTAVRARSRAAPAARGAARAGRHPG
jgi:hypothetical protein